MSVTYIAGDRATEGVKVKRKAVPARGKTKRKRILFRGLDYEAQVPQLPELQLEQDEDEPPAPGMVLATLPMLWLKAEKTDILRRASALQAGHSQDWPDWLSERIFSNLVSHSGQMYS